MKSGGMSQVLRACYFGLAGGGGGVGGGEYVGEEVVTCFCFSFSLLFSVVLKGAVAAV